MTRLTYPQEHTQDPILQGTSKASSEADQILYLKRLIVTVKQQYEKNLSDLQAELVAEQSKSKNLSNEFADFKSNHDEELTALKNQQSSLRELLKKAQEELRTLQAGPAGPSLSSLESQLKADLELSQNTILELQTTLEQERAASKNELERLQQALSDFEAKDDQQELITSNTSSYQLRRELDLIKKTFLESMEESKTIEKRYADLFDEKMRLEHQVKQLHTQLEHQSTNLMSFEGQLEDLNAQKKKLEQVINELERNAQQVASGQEELNVHMQQLEEQCREKVILQEKYEQLKEEFMLLSSNQEDAIDLRVQAEQRMMQLDALAQEQENTLNVKIQELEQLTLEREHLHADLNHLHELLGETELQLKTAQQHLAKKVKEAAILSEKVTEQQNTLTEYHLVHESAKGQINQLQSSLELYQQQEKRLQEQLHEALKGTESQVAKWEKKYFEMYEKWQDSENQIRELRKFEEKHLQMQNLLSNLGNFMGSNVTATQLYQAMQSPSEAKISKAPTFDVEPEIPESEMTIAPTGYDMFGMRHAEKPKQPPFS